MCPLFFCALISFVISFSSTSVVVFVPFDRKDFRCLYLFAVYRRAVLRLLSLGDDSGPRRTCLFISFGCLFLALTLSWYLITVHWLCFCYQKVELYVIVVRNRFHFGMCVRVSYTLASDAFCQFRILIGIERCAFDWARSMSFLFISKHIIIIFGIFDCFDVYHIYRRRDIPDEGVPTTSFFRQFFSLFFFSSSAFAAMHAISFFLLIWSFHCHFFRRIFR